MPYPREADPPAVYSETTYQPILSSAGNLTSNHNIHDTNRSILTHFAWHPLQDTANNSPFPWVHPLEAPVTSINSGTFIGGNLNHIQHPSETGLHILHRAIAGDAFHDSADRYPQPRCHPDTRLKMLDMLRYWAHGNGLPKNWTAEDHDPAPEDPEFCEDQGSRLLWLHGPAGSGKSAISQSFCQKLQADNLLGGSFFFKRGHPSRGNAKKLFPTIAYQLALLLPSFKHFVSQRMESDPAIVDRSLVNQLQALIIEPCRNSAPPQPMIIVIDGLDECEGHDIQEEILRSVAHAMHEEHISLRFFVASRPEPHITEIFREPALEKFHHSLFIDQSFKDVRKYLEDEFNRIRREHRFTMATIPSPSSETIEGLVEKSSGYFIYAAIVIRFIDDRNFRPTDRLETVLGIKECNSESPFDSLDQLYLQILSFVPPDSRSQLLRILTVIGAGLLLHPFHIEQLLELKMGDCHLILRGLHSIVSVPAPEEGVDGGFICTGYHASFLDFLNNSTRSGTFFVGGTQQRVELAGHILNAFSYKKSDYPLPPQYAGQHVQHAW
ncbi:hypothetical protein GGX14DRAFT_579596 [Mycena pura]|uniref:Nephrocystin 3-like N-terminal domain-containing protein n=1 Tax=Mycena pura TaxID=153505 RepID=A0AAD6URU3_9AGAR|nr:hypothetical protein GGX14DRAFT_579596 [Mycena pura]